MTAVATIFVRTELWFGVRMNGDTYKQRSSWKMIQLPQKGRIFLINQQCRNKCKINEVENRSNSIPEIRPGRLTAKLTME